MDGKRRRIVVVVGDIGAARELLPVVAELERRGHQVKWIADPVGKAKDTLTNQGIAFDTNPQFDGDLDLILVGTSATAYRYQIEHTLYGKARGIPVIWLEDLYTTGSRQEVRVIDPTCMLVIDSMARDIVCHARPKLADVRVVGKPTFEDLPGFLARAETLRRETRAGLGVKDDQCLGVYWSRGSHPIQIGKDLSALQLINRFWGKEFVLAARFHPKLPPGDLKILWDNLTSGISWVDARRIGQEGLNLAADVVFVHYSGTEGYRASLLGRPVITLIPLDDAQDRFDCGYIDGVVPLVKAGASFPVSHSQELAAVANLKRVDADLLCRGLLSRRGPFLPLLRPGAAVCIADAVESFFG